jgi:hypothetical protein
MKTYLQMNKERAEQDSILYHGKTVRRCQEHTKWSAWQIWGYEPTCPSCARWAIAETADEIRQLRAEPAEAFVGIGERAKAIGDAGDELKRLVS